MAQGLGGVEFCTLSGDSGKPGISPLAGAVPEILQAEG